MRMKRALSKFLAGAALAAVVAVGSVSPAAADNSEPVPEPVASAQGWDIGVGNIGASVKLDAQGGLVAEVLKRLGLIRALNGLLDGVLTPVTGLVNALPNRLLNPVLGAVAGTNLRAGTPPADATPAEAPYPLSLDGVSPTPATLESCRDAPNTCYSSWIGGVGEIDAALPGLLALDLGVIHGVTEFVSTTETTDSYDIVAQSQVAGLGLDLLGIPVLDLGAVTSTARCTVVGSAPNSAETSVADLSLLGGLVGVGLADETGALEVTVDGQPLVGLDKLPLGIGVGSGVLSEVTLDGDLLRVKVGLSVKDLLGSLGAAGDLVKSLLSLLVSPDIGAFLVIEVAGGATTDEHSAAAHGLRVSVGLDLDVRVDLLPEIRRVPFVGWLVSGLLGQISASIEVAGSGDVAGNLLQLDLAKAQCSSTALPGSENTWIPPGLT